MNTDIYILVNNKTTGRKQYISSQSDAGGVVTLVTEGLGLMAEHSYEFSVIARPGSPCDKKVLTIGDFSGECVRVTFENAKDSEGCPVVFTSVELEVTAEPNLTEGCECLTQEMIDSWIESVVGGNGITVDNTDPQNPIVNALTPPLNDGLISGGRVTWIANYDYEVSAATYVIGGVLYNSPLTNITLAASDPVNDRLDTFILDDTGTASALTGTPSAPPVIENDIDVTTQLRIAFALVTAASVAPTLPTENIYLENTEWVTADNTANITLASGNNPYAGAVDIEGTAVANGNFITFTPASFPSLILLDSLVFKIRSKAAWNNASRLVFQFQNGTTNVGNAVNFGNLSYGFVSSTTGAYQNINIPLTDFGNIAAATRLRIMKTGAGTIGFYLDNIQMVGNNNVIVTPQVNSDLLQTNPALPSFILNNPKRYVAFITQAGGAAPTVVIRQNNIGNIVWTRDSQGFYLGILLGAFISDTNCYPDITKTNGAAGDYVYFKCEDADMVSINTFDVAGVAQDNMLNNYPIKIEVYP